MGLMDTIRDKVLSWLRPDEYANEEVRERMINYALWNQYYQGNYRPQMKVRPFQANDNIGLNFVGLVVDRSISLLLGAGIEFDFGENEAAQEYIRSVYEANKGNILLHKASQYSSIHGTGYLKILPDEVKARDSSGKLYPRLIALDPKLLTIQTKPEDIETVTSYTIRFNVADDNGKEQARKQVIAIDESGLSWTITDYVANYMGQWENIHAENWPYEFAPIIHWQNLPQPSDVYGQSDVEDIIEPQDRYNFVVSNISKIIRYHAHPLRWGRGLGTMSKQSWGADEMLSISGENGEIRNLEMETDLGSSQAFAMLIRQAIFDISRTVDITSLADKLGALTNFGLRVLYTDALAKLGTKRELMGEALIEANHRMLEIANIEHEDGGKVVWGDTIPTDEAEDLNSDKADLEMGLVSKQTIAKKRGYDYEQEQQLIGEEKTAQGNIGEVLLSAFNRGQ